MASDHRSEGDRVEERDPPRGSRAPYGKRKALWFKSFPRNHENSRLSGFPEDLFIAEIINKVCSLGPIFNYQTREKILTPTIAFLIRHDIILLID